MELKVVLFQCFFTLCVLCSVDSKQAKSDIRVKRYAQNFHSMKKHVLDEAVQERIGGQPGRNDLRGKPYVETFMQRGSPNQRGPPDHRGPPNGKGPPAHKGPPANRGPPPNRGPPDHRGPPNKVPPNDLETRKPPRETPPNNQFSQGPTNVQFVGGQNITPLPLNTFKPQPDKNIGNPIYDGNIEIYEYEGKPAFQVIPVTPES